MTNPSVLGVWVLTLGLVSAVPTTWDTVVVGTQSNSHVVDGVFSLTPEHSAETALLVEASQLSTALGSSDILLASRGSISIDTELVVESTHRLSLVATTQLTVRAPLKSRGVLQLSASTGVTVQATLHANLLQISADQRHEGTGVLAVESNGSLHAEHSMRLYAADVQLAGTVDCDSSVHLSASPAAREIGFGDTAKDFHLSGQELQRIRGDSLMLTGGLIFVDGITADQAQGLRGTVSLVAPTFGSHVSFGKNPSVFRALTVLADAGVEVYQNVSTTEGALMMNGNLNKAFYLQSTLSIAEAEALEQHGARIQQHEGLLEAAEEEMRVEVTRDLVGYKRARARRAVLQEELSKLRRELVRSETTAQQVREDCWDHAIREDHRLSHEAGSEFTMLDTRNTARRAGFRAAEQGVKDHQQGVETAEAALKAAGEAEVAAQQAYEEALVNPVALDEEDTTDSDTSSARLNATMQALETQKVKHLEAEKTLSVAKRLLVFAEEKMVLAKQHSDKESAAIQSIYSGGIMDRAQQRKTFWLNSLKKNLWNRLRVRALLHGKGMHDGSTLLVEELKKADIAYSEFLSARFSAQTLRALLLQRTEWVQLEQQVRKEGRDKQQQQLEALRNSSEVTAELQEADAVEKRALEEVQQQVDAMASHMLTWVHSKWIAEQAYLDATKEMRQQQVNEDHILRKILQPTQEMSKRAAKLQLQARERWERRNREQLEAAARLQQAVDAHAELVHQRPQGEAEIASAQAEVDALATVTANAMQTLQAAEDAVRDAEATLKARRQEAQSIADTALAAQVSVGAAIARDKAVQLAENQTEAVHAANKTEFAARRVLEGVVEQFNTSRTIETVKQRKVELEAATAAQIAMNKTLEAYIAQAVNVSNRVLAVQREAAKYTQKIKDAQIQLNQRVIETNQNTTILDTLMSEGKMELTPTLNLADQVHLSAATELSLGQPEDGGIMLIGHGSILHGKDLVELNDDLVAKSAENSDCKTAPEGIDLDTTGVLKLLAGVTLRSRCHQVSIRAADVKLDGAVKISKQALLLNVPKGGHRVGLGGTTNTQEMHLSGDELQRITTQSGLMIDSSPGGTIVVDGVTEIQGGALQNLTLVASGFGSQVVFESNASTFAALTAQSDGGIEVNQNITASSGKINFGRTDSMGEDEKRSSALVALEAGVALVAADGVKFGLDSSGNSTSNQATFKGQLLLRSKSNAGVLLSGGLRADGLGGEVTIDAGKGVLTVPTGRHLDSNGHAVKITALDIDLQGTLQAGPASVTVHGGAAGQGIAVGGEHRHKVRAVTRSGNLMTMRDSPVEMHLSDSELGRLHATGGLNIGSHLSGSIHVGEISEESAETSGLLTLMATRKDAKVDFLAHPNTSSFPHGLTVDADGAITVAQNLTFDEDTQLHSAGLLKVLPSVALTTMNHSINISAADMQLDGNISTGFGFVGLDCGKPGSVMAIGHDVQGDLHITGEELQRIQTRSMQLGGWGCHYHVLNGVKQEYTENIEGVVSLLAHRDDGKIIFGNEMSWFPTLTAQADNGLFVHSDLKTYKGDLQLDADLNEDNCTETTPPVCRSSSTKLRQHVVAFADAVTIQAKRLLSLGGVWQSPKAPWDEAPSKKVKKIKKVGEALSVNVPITVDDTEEVERDAPAAPVLQHATAPLPESNVDADEEATAEAAAVAEAAAEAAAEEAMMEAAALAREDGERQVDTWEVDQVPGGDTAVVKADEHVRSPAPQGERLEVVDPEGEAEASEGDSPGSCLALLGYKKYMHALFVQSPARP